jgi:hypothetical protein
MDYTNKLKLFVMKGWVFRGKEEKWVDRSVGGWSELNKINSVTTRLSF